jgi:hypothetical protein
MASAVYPKGIIHIMSGDITGGLDGADIRAVLLDTATYTYNAAHEYYSDLSGVVATETGVFGSKTIGVVGTGVFDAANATVTGATGTTAEAIAVFVDTGNSATDILLSYNELSAPVTPNGGDIVLQFSGSGIFSL